MLKQLFHGLLGLLRRRRFVRPEDMPPEAMEQALREARFLRGHAVDAHRLAPGETPAEPRRADER